MENPPSVEERLEEIIEKLALLLGDNQVANGIRDSQIMGRTFKFIRLFDMLTMNQRRSYIEGTKFGRVIENQEMLYRFDRVVWGDVNMYSHDREKGKLLENLGMTNEEIIAEYFSQQ